MTLRPLLLVLTHLLIFSAKAQPKNFTQIEDAEEHFENGNYLFAIKAFQSELKKDPGNSNIKFKLGLCYLNTRISREDAITYLEEAAKDPKTDGEIWFFLGRAYHLTNRIDDAISAYEKFSSLKPKLAADAEHHLEQCRNAKLLMASPADVTLQNLGKHINSEEPDYNPFVDRNECYLFFTSRRRENIGGKKIEVDGYRSSDIYESVIEKGSWTTAKNAGRGINTNLDEQIVGLRSDGLELYMYLDHIDKFGDIYVSAKRDESSEFAKPKKLDDVINTNIETSGCMSDDGQILFFARRNTMDENSDLYMSLRLPNSKWAVPQKLPETINTPYNEEVPFISVDNETLYFSSQGHNSMGGYDLFKSKWDRKTNTFSKPENMGFPINTTDDDRSICVTSNNRLAYISSFRPNGFGDLDLYRVKFNNTEELLALYTGRVYMGDTIENNQPRSFGLNIIVTNKKTEYEYTFAPNSKTGRFIMILPEGEYELTVQTKGFEKYSETIFVSDLGPPNIERPINIILKKKPVTTKVK